MAIDRLAGQVALVTGGGRGIGRHVALGLAANGARVAVLSRTRSEVEAVAREIVSSGRDAVAIEGDVTVRPDVDRAVGEVESRLGPLSLLVNNAGTCRAIGPVSVVDPDEWWREVEIHLRGAALVTHFALAAMIPRQRGRIINIYGNLGDRRGAYTSAYAVAKASVLRLTEQIAVENADSGIVAIALHPGLVRTPLIEELAKNPDAQRWLPGFKSISPDRFISPDRLIRAAVGIAAGTADALTGRCVGAWEDIERAATDAQATHDDARMLRVIQPESDKRI